MAGNDAGGISTYSTAGAKFGYMTLWAIPVMCILLIVVQTTATRMGIVTGKGFSALIRERFGIRLTALAMLALLIGNIATTFSEFAGVAAGMEMFGVPRWISVPVAALAVWALIVGGSYKRVQNIFLAISCVFCYLHCGGIFLAQPNWNLALINTVVPQASSDIGFLSLMVSMVGATIAPWMMFFTQSNVVEKWIGYKGFALSAYRCCNGRYCRLYCCLVYYRNHRNRTFPPRYRKSLVLKRQPQLWLPSQDPTLKHFLQQVW